MPEEETVLDSVLMIDDACGYASGVDKIRRGTSYGEDTRTRVAARRLSPVCVVLQCRFFHDFSAVLFLPFWNFVLFFLCEGVFSLFTFN